MEFKVMTKTEEIAIIGFKTAKENCELATKIVEEEAERKRIEKEKRLAEEQKALNEIYIRVMEIINKAANEGWHCTQILWTENNPKPVGVDWSAWCNHQDTIIQFFNSLGYYMGKMYIYSDSWTYRSGKIGYVTIQWYESTIKEIAEKNS